MLELLNVFKILSDETRLRILVLLYQEDLCVCELCGVLDVPQSRVSKNLGKLRDLKWVADKRDDKFVIYSLNKNNLLLNQILESVIDSKEKYNQITSDLERLLNKDNYASRSCSINKKDNM